MEIPRILGCIHRSRTLVERLLGTKTLYFCDSPSGFAHCFIFRVPYTLNRTNSDAEGTVGCCHGRKGAGGIETPSRLTAGSSCSPRFLLIVARCAGMLERACRSSIYSMVHPTGQRCPASASPETQYPGRNRRAVVASNNQFPDYVLHPFL